ncbi:hypothetical protein P9D54_11320 [Bacillus haynesii]|uniref:hypothetical protein n=1 Tax=Bacillus haynesii TaxID=1925021 RepID=UPI002DBBF447|nr:hypothetical protein [Bacillus haynesii]MEC1345959.1 hypothetical protein [Bacillus haynesii]
MNFGKNTQLVEEVMSFIRNNKMFFNKNFNVPNLQVINNFSDAQNFAWSQDLNEVDTVWENVKILETENIVENIYDLDLATQQDELYEYFGDYENYSEHFLPFDYVGD